MNAIELLTHTFETQQQYLADALADFSDAELLVRSAPNANHAAWMLTHLIVHEVHMMKFAIKAPMPTLDQELVCRAEAGSEKLDNPADFLKKDQLLALFAQVRQASIASIKTLSESDLDKPTDIPSKVGQILPMVTEHLLMHLGQIQAIRRKLNKPILF